MLLQYVASLESKSEHPLGKAIAAYYKGMKGNFMEVTNFLMAVGKGVRGTVDGKDIIVGNEELLLENHIIINEVEKDRIEQLKGEGAIVIHTVINSTYAGAIALADVLRDEAKDMVVRMHQNGLECVLMTGDEEKAAKHIAAKVGIKKVLAKCLPETKMQTIREYQEKGKKVCMIGDGVNDAPSLKAANVGIAMGGIGSDIAIDASDIALISDDIKYLPHLIALSKKTMKTININLVLSMTLNFIAIILAMTGILNPIVGALVHNVGSIAVIIHSSLLLNWRK
jgi:P-type E1-E2 ATPase